MKQWLREPSPASEHMLDFLATLYDRVDRQIAERLAAGGRPVTCAPGCDACCHYPLRVTGWEMAAIQAALKRLPAATHERIHKQLVKAKKKVAPLRASFAGGNFPEAEHARLAYCALRVRCPLLLHNRCAVYSVRPINCRTHFVVSLAEDCLGGDKEVVSPDLSDIAQAAQQRIEASAVTTKSRALEYLLVDALKI